MMLAIGEQQDFTDEIQRVSLCEALDRILNKGAVVSGELTIAVANVDLLYLSLQLVITSVETAKREMLHVRH
ncbi:MULTISPECIES: gas vesicle protein [unclassified Thiocapsa]|uniref:gas vesicle protein n=1 Tax=unclassified Thiocapsa TaxID=2641286 RepID=UPI001BCE3BF2|nr:gas vesicle protein [Thiocapsa sp.]QVL47589.1 MAG: gas vesicle protein [Thiocapsa sp.]QVL49903.1 MAG: gas vesicle protein [Thiocapsa sp.]